MAPDDLPQQLQSALGSAYAIERELGGGGMSRVFVAEETRFRRMVVIKVLSRELAGAVSTERFEREITVAAGLQHTHIVPVLDAGEVNGLPWYSMPYVDGESLRDRMRRGRLTKAEALLILRDVARALAHAHRNGIVHRDIKPENVLLSGGSAVVTDFGIAKAVSAALTNPSAATLTQTGMSLGTPAYMSPEQAVGGTVDQAADVYAWGVMAYELLAGRHPFAERHSAQQLVAAHLTETPSGEPLSGTDPGLAGIVLRCLAKNPVDRPTTAVALLEALDDAALAATPTEPVPAHTFRKWRVAAALGLAGVLALVYVTVAIRKESSPSAATHAASIAVLPLATVGGGPNEEFLGEGITEEIGNALATVPGLRVAARTSARAAHERGFDVREIGRTLGVSRVLQGTVQRGGDRLRVNVQLVNTADGFEVWSRRFDRDAKDIFAVQDEIARAVAGLMRPDADPSSPTRLARSGTTDADAHTLYLQGLYHLNRRNPESLQKAVGFFQRAIGRDPSYARAHAQLGVTHAVFPDYVAGATEASEDRALEAASRALALDSTIAEAHAVRGLVFGVRWQNSAANEAFNRGLAAEPNNPLVLFWRGIFLLRFSDRQSESIAVLRRALELDPLSRVIGVAYGRALYMAGDPARALAEYERVAQIDSAYSVLPLYRALALERMGRGKDALRVYMSRQTEADLLGWGWAYLGYFRAAAGDSTGATQALAAAQARRARGADILLAILQAKLGLQDDAVASFIRGFEAHDSFLDDWPHDPRLAPLRRDSRLARYFALMEAPP